VAAAEVGLLVGSFRGVELKQSKGFLTNMQVRRPHY
jgi:hypothetical protein